MIRVTQYFWNGNMHSEHDYGTVEQAFQACELLKLTPSMTALARPVDTTCGCYVYDPKKDGHTLEGFKAKMALCCNDPAEYSENLIRAGICKPHYHKGF